MIATERLYWNATRTRLVPDGKEAAFLAYPVGAKVPDAIASAHGLAEPERPSEPPLPGGDSAENLQDRQAKPGRRRSRSS